MRAYITLLFFGGILASSPGHSAAVVSHAPLKQKWHKRGVVMKPGFAGPRSAQFVSSPSVIRLENGRLRMYFWAADGVPPWHGRHIILAAEADAGDAFEWNLISDNAMLGPDPSGDIRDKGVGFPYVLARDDGPWLMYYGTWGSWAPNNELSNRTGLAKSTDQGLTWKVHKETLLPLGKAGSYDAGLTGSVTVLRDGEQNYMMWYTAGEKYVRFGERNRGIVHLGVAHSTDGVNWQKWHEPAIRARQEAVNPYEAVVSKPAVVRLDGTYHMWLSVYSMGTGSIPSDESDRYGRYDRSSDRDRSDWERITRGEAGYRIEYARSSNGVDWQRFAGQPVMSLTPGAFDSKNQSYPNVIDMGDELWMFYVGNEFGSTGIGLATLDKAFLRDEHRVEPGP